MEILDSPYKIRCEFGACKNIANKTIKLKPVGIKSQIHICEECMSELYNNLKNVFFLRKIDDIKIQNENTCVFKLEEDTMICEQDGEIKECWWYSDCQTRFYERGEDMIVGVISWNFCPDCGRPCKQTDFILQD